MADVFGESLFNDKVTAFGGVETTDVTTKTVTSQDLRSSGSSNLNNLNVVGVSTLQDINLRNATASNITVSGISTLGNTVVGGATTQLVVNGNARITGILTIGTGSITLDGITNNITGISSANAVTVNSSAINVGTAVTINSGIISATTFVKSGGTSAQYLRANGSSEELNITYGNNSGNTTYVYPPSGFAIGDLIGFIPSWRYVAYNGTVNGDDTSYCNYSIETGNNRVAVTCYTSEQRDTPQNNWFAIWRKTV